MRMEDLPKDPHKPYEDIMAMLLGTLFVALGVTFYTHAVLLTGSTADGATAQLPDRVGIWRVVFCHQPAVLLSGDQTHGVELYAAHLCRHWLGLAVLRAYSGVGRICQRAVALRGTDGRRIDGDWHADAVSPPYQLGGINILALYLQDKHGLRAGYVQLGIDAVILLVALTQLPLDRVGYSVLGALMLNLIIALNHKPGRYIGVS